MRSSTPERGGSLRGTAPRTLARLVAAVAPLLASACTSSGVPPAGAGDAAARGLPAPQRPGLSGRDEERFREERRAWIEEMHRTPPGVDWRAVERANGEREVWRRRLLAREAARGTAVSVSPWTEVGSRNQAGRMHCGVLGPDGPAGRRLYAGSALGGLWRAAPDGTGWEPLGDDLFGGVHELVVLPGAAPGDPDRLVVATDGGLVHVSHDDGQSWQVPAGLPALSWVRGLTQLEDAAGTVLLYARPTGGFSRPALFASTDGGLSFVQRWEGAQDWTGSIWVPRTGAAAATDVYLLHRGRLQRSTNGGASFQTLATIDTSADRGVLTGCEAGAPTLYAALRVGGQWQLHRSDDGGSTFAQVATMSDFWEALCASTVDPSLVAYGGVECWRSTDGGQSFQRINGWGAYYGDPQHKLHADIMGIYCRPAPGAFPPEDLWFIATDGGLYESSDGLSSVLNLSLEGLGVGQYYATLSSGADPTRLLAGSQDQGYQRGLVQPSTGPGPSTDFDQLISGDYGHLTSPDGTHRFVFSTYPGFILAQKGEVLPALFFEDFPAGANHLWLPPVVADPGSADDAFFFLGDRLWRYPRIAAHDWAPVLHSNQDFAVGGGQYLSALAVAPSDPQRMLAANDAGVLFRSLDHGVTWTEVSGNGPAGHYFYGSSIVIDPTNPDEAFVGGSGYGGNPVWRTTDGGVTWQPASTGLPPTLVYRLAYAADGSGDVFAAAEAGAYRWSRSSGVWENIMGAEAPITLYWWVEAVPDGQTMRFSTYGRGIWDHVITPSTDGTFAGYGYEYGGANVLTLDSVTPPNIGQHVRFDVTGGNGPANGPLLAGRIPAAIPAFGGTQLVDQVVRHFPLSLDASGSGSFGFTLPNDPALIGLHFYFQARIPDASQPQGIAWSNGLEMVVGF